MSDAYVSDLELVCRQLVAGKLPVAKFNRFVREHGASVLLQPLPFAGGLSLLQQNVLHQNSDNNPAGRLAITSACVAHLAVSWNDDVAALDQPLAWVLAGLLPSASIPNVKGGALLLDAIFPSELDAHRRAQRWEDVLSVLAHVWKSEPVRFSAPMHEFRTWWRYATFDLGQVIPGVNAHEATFMTAWQRAHGSMESQARFVAGALRVLEVAEAFPENNPSLSPLSFLPFSPRARDLLASPVLQEAIACQLEPRSSMTAKEKVMQESLAFQWWAWAPHEALVKFDAVSLSAWGNLAATDRQNAADETLVMSTMEQAFSQIQNSRGSWGPSGTSMYFNTLMIGPLSFVPLRYASFVKEQKLNASLPPPVPSRLSPRF